MLSGRGKMKSEGGINNFKHEDVLVKLKSNVSTTGDMRINKRLENEVIELGQVKLSTTVLITSFEDRRIVNTLESIYFYLHHTWVFHQV